VVVSESVIAPTVSCQLVHQVHTGL
jgi:hypothetical protein